MEPVFVDAEEHNRLKAEFSRIDADNNGRVDKEEMDSFLKSRGIDEEHRIQIVDELFSKCDIDNNGKIELDEFIKHYLDTKN